VFPDTSFETTVHFEATGGNGVNLPDIVFSQWTRWTERGNLDGINEPGVYILAHFTTPPSGNADPQVKEIIYIGETCERTLQIRWREFDRAAFQNRDTHAGGITYREIFGDKGDTLFVAKFPLGAPSEEFRPFLPLLIRYVERKLLLEYALKWGGAPRCNKR
jgi:hypothetical protein